MRNTSESVLPWMFDTSATPSEASPRMVIGPDKDGVRFFRGLAFGLGLAALAWMVIGGLVALVVVSW